MDRQTKVAVIGAGAAGLVAIKNMLEEGYDVTAFEQRERAGGLWAYTEKPEWSSAIHETVLNSSKQRSCFTDFPFGDDVPDFPKASQMHTYLEDYCSQFSLEPHIRFDSYVQKLCRSTDDKSWLLEVRNGDTSKAEEFDKVILASGREHLPHMPQIEGLETFKGNVLHSVAYKRLRDFENKTVLILGCGATAVDIAQALKKVTKNLYLSYRGGHLVLPRRTQGTPLDHGETQRLGALMGTMAGMFPAFMHNEVDKHLRSLQLKQFGPFDPSWRLSDPPSVAFSAPVVTDDDFIESLRTGSIQTCDSIRRILPNTSTVELVDGTLLESVDAIICCTGYRYDFSLLPSPMDPSNSEIGSQVGEDHMAPPKLFQNTISLEYPDSLAFLGIAGFPYAHLQIMDLQTMALAQIWKGNSALPTKAEMEKQILERDQWVADLYAKGLGPVDAGLLQPGLFLNWLGDMAGTGVNEKLGYGLEGWRYWMSDVKFCNLLMGGMKSPHFYRLFDGEKRKKWDGAREAILKVNGLKG